MSLLELCERIQETWVSRILSESTWGYPVVGALHVLAIALFGGVVLIPHLSRFESALLDVRWIRRAGLTLIVLTGTLLFAAGASGYYKSTSFKIKLVLRRQKDGTLAEAYLNGERFARKLLKGMSNQTAKIALGCRNLHCEFDDLAIAGLVTDRPSKQLAERPGQ